jgi:hypothetical protein
MCEKVALKVEKQDDDFDVEKLEENNVRAWTIIRAFYLDLKYAFTTLSMCAAVFFASGMVMLLLGESESRFSSDLRGICSAPRRS